MKRNEIKLLLNMECEMFLDKPTFVLKKLRQTGREKCSQEMSKSSLSIRLERLQNIANWQREHNSVYRMCNALWDENVFFVWQNHGTVDCCYLQECKKKQN